MSKVEKKKPNEFMKSLNNFSNKMFEKSTGLTAPNTSDYEDEPYSYNVPAQSPVYIQQPSDRQYINTLYRSPMHLEQVSFLHWVAWRPQSFRLLLHL